MPTLTDRASFLREFFRLLDVDAGDPGLTEFDGEDLESAHLLLNQGLWDAQDFLISTGRADRWVTTVAWPDHDGSGRDYVTDDTTGNSYVELPDDVLRLAGDEEESAFHDSNGRSWGRLIKWSMRRRVAGNVYWHENNRLYLADGANPPNDLYLDYHHRLPELADGTTPDFPREDRMLVVAHAAELALDEAWIPGGDDTIQRVVQRLQKCQRRAYKRGRRSRQPRQMRPERIRGTHWFG